MNDLRNIRRNLGLTQQAMAEYLGVSRQMISMSESRQRSLPVPALLRLQQLTDAARTPSLAAEQRQLRSRSHTRVALRKRLRTCRLEVRRLQRKLQRMQRHYQKADAFVRCCEAMLDRSDSDHAHWKRQLRLSEHRLLACGPAAQALLEAKMAAAEAEVQALEKGLTVV